MTGVKRMLSIIFSSILILETLFSGSPVQGAGRPTPIPQIQFASAPVTEYTVGDRVRFNIYSPNYGGRVEYRVILWNDSQKTYYDLWNAGNGYPGRYYTKWQPYGNNIFTLGWPIFEPGYYRITVCVKRVGIPNNKTALRGMNCDSYMESVAFRVKPRAVEVQYIMPISDITVKQGDIPVLPSTVRAVMSDRSEKNLRVSWSVVDTSRTGSFAVLGNVEGTDKKAVVRLIVNQAPLNVYDVSAANEATVNVVLKENISFIPDMSRFLLRGENSAPVKINTLNLPADRKVIQLVTEHMIPGNRYNLSIDGKDYSFKVPGLETKISIEEVEDFNIEAGKTEVISISTLPEGTEISADSSDKDIAIVKVKDNRLTIEGIDTGAAAITVKASKNGYKSNSASFKVYVNKLEADPDELDAIEDFDNTLILDIKGHGEFSRNIGIKSITLGGDIKGMEVVSVSRIDGESHKARIRLKGDIIYKSGYGTVAVSSSGWNGTHSLTASIEINPLRQVSKPTAVPQPGEVDKGTQVVLTSVTNKAEIYYTIDGTTPTKNSTKYAEPITIEKDVTIKAVAVKDGMLDSSVAALKYTIKETVFYLLRINPIEDISVEYGTPISAVKLPAEVEIAAGNGVNEVVRKAGVKWDTSGYNRNKVGVYNIKGTLVLPHDVINPNNIKANLKITVVLKIKTIKNVKANAAVFEPFILPKTVEAVMSNDTVQKVGVTWKAPNGINITDGKVTIETTGIYQFTGAVNGYSGAVTLDLEIRSPLKLGWDSNVTDTGTKRFSTSILKIQEIIFYALPVQGVSKPANEIRFIIEWQLPAGITMDDIQILDNTAIKSEDKWYVVKDGKTTFNITSKQSFSIKAVFKKPGDYNIKISEAKNKYASLSASLAIGNSFGNAAIQIGNLRAIQESSSGQNTGRVFIQQLVGEKWQDICVTNDEQNGQLSGFFVVNKTPFTVISSIKSGLIIASPGDNGSARTVGSFEFDGKIELEGYRAIQGSLIGKNPEGVYIQNFTNGKWITLGNTVDVRGYEQLTGFFIVDKLPYAIIMNSKNEYVVVTPYNGSIKAIGQIKWN